MMAIFTVGVDEIRLRKMEDIAEAWGFAGKYDTPERLVTDAKKKRFKYILVIDYEALDKKVREELQTLGIEIISLKDQKKLEKKIL
jgi:hypothetical protein